MRNFRKLEVWKEAIELVIKVYELTKQIPEAELFGLIRQMKRAVVSIPSNIAEGASRSTSKDFARFLEIAIGSSFELETQLIICKKLQYYSEEQLNPILLDLESLQKRINKLRESILR